MLTDEMEEAFERLDQQLLRRQIDLDGCVSQGEVIDFRRQLGELKNEVLDLLMWLTW